MEKLAAQPGHPGSLHPTPYQQLDTDNPGPSCATILPEQATPPDFQEGIQIIHDEPDAIVDICFVHGLVGNRSSAWTVVGQRDNWPKEFLPYHLKRVRLLTFGYNANGGPISTTSPITFVDHALRLLADLTNNRLATGASSRPLIFVSRGLGDVICKEAVVLSHGSPSDLTRGIYQHLQNVIRLGVLNETYLEMDVQRNSHFPQAGEKWKFDVVEPLFNSLYRSEISRGTQIYMHLCFEFQASQLLSSSRSGNLVAMEGCDGGCDGPPHDLNASTSVQNSQRRVHQLLALIFELRKLVAAISSPPMNSPRMRTSETQDLASTSATVPRSSLNTRLRHPRPYARSHTPPPGNPVQSTDPIPGSLPLPTPNTRPTGLFKVPPCYIICLMMFLIVVGSASLGIYYTIRFNKMGDGFTAASWIVAIGTLALAGPLARHYPNCSCWSPRMRYSYGFGRASPVPII